MVSWVAWFQLHLASCKVVLIARMGGHSSDRSQWPPGPPSFTHLLEINSPVIAHF